MTRPVSILRWGSYLPRYRMPRDVIAKQVEWLDPALARARGQRTLANWDEDAITMAVAAGRAALGRQGGDVGALTFASTSAPFLDRSNVGLIADALGLDPHIALHEAAGSQRAATGALLSAFERPRDQPELIVAGDRRGAPCGSPLELHYGDGAAAFVVGRGDGAAEFLGGARVHDDLIHQYRTHEQPTDYVFEDRWVRDEGVLATVPDTVRRAADNAGVSVADLTQLVVALPTRHGRKVCAALDLANDLLVDDLSADVGQTGVGHAFLQLAHALETARPGDLMALVGFGQGVDVSVLRVADRVADLRPAMPIADARTSGVTVNHYLKLPVFGRQLRPERGMRGEADKRTAASVHHRRRRDLNAMLGSQCTACGTPHFPRARRCVNCGATDQMRDYAFADRAAMLKTFTEDWQAATPSPPMCYGNVAFDGGGNALLELTDVKAGSLAIGTRLSMQFRVKDFDEARGFRRYFWKPAPVIADG